MISGSSHRSVSAEQFVRFPPGGLDSREFLKLAQAGKVAIEVDHPKLAVRAEISRALGELLSKDLID